MKKVFKVILYSFLFVGVIALVVCFLAIPEQTKNFFDIIIDYINRPLPIIGVSTLVLCIFIYKVISNTSIGSKGLKKLLENFSELKNKYDELENKVKEYELKYKDYEDKSNALIKSFSIEIDNLYLALVNTCKQSPNKKIQNMALEIQESYEGTKNELHETLVNGGNELADYIDTKQIETKEKLAYLEERINALIQMVEGELNNGEGKEGTNSSSNEE